MTPTGATRIAGLTALAADPRGPARETPLLFVHGMNGGAWMWQRWLAFFADRGWRSVAIDLRGHHGSRPVPALGRVSVLDYVDDARAAADALGRPIVVGHSMGGLIAQKLAETLALPAVVAVTPAPPRGIFALGTRHVVAASLRHLPEILGRRPLRPTFGEAEVLLLGRVPPSERRAVYDRLVAESGRAAFEISVTGVPVDAARVRSRMLVLAASEDGIVAAAVARKVAAKYGAEFREYAGHGHMLLMEPGWESIAKEVADWL